MKKVLSVALTAACLAGSVAALSACTESVQITEVSTAEEFLNASGVVSLLNDIDLNYANLSGEPKIVFGNGYTVSNAIVSSDITGRVFGLGTHDVTVENFDVTVSKASSFGFVAAGLSYSTRTENFVQKHYFQAVIKDVHIKNCKVELELVPENTSYIGGLLGYTANGNTGIQSDSAIDITNCSVEGLEIVATTPSLSSYWESSNPIYFGGLVGSGEYIKMKNCYAEDCTFTAVAGGTKDYIRMGGLIGYMQGNSELSHCYVKNSTIEAQAKAGTGSSVLGTRITSVTRVGGIAGSSATGSQMDCCYSEGNTVVSDCGGGTYLGGVIGVAYCPISQSYAVGNDLVCKGRFPDDNATAEFHVGGLAGNVGDVLIRSSFAFDNEASFVLKELNEKYFYLTDRDITDCKDFLNEYYNLYTTNKSELESFMANIRSGGYVDTAVFDAFASDVGEKIFARESELKDYLDSYYASVAADYKKLDLIYVGGLAGTTSENSMVQNCAAGIAGTNCHCDLFSKNKITSNTFDAAKCYVLPSRNGSNVNGCAALSEEQTYGSSLKEKLLLTDEQWVISETELPVLALK